MVILITGASHTGKTVLAQRLLERFRYPYLSIDHIKMGLIRSGNTDLTPEDDDELTNYLWPIVREIIKTAIENSQDLIIEGCYIPSNWKDDLEEEYLSSIRIICLVFTDSYVDRHYDDIVKHRSDVEKRMYDMDLTPEDIKAQNRKYLEGFKDDALLIDDDYGKAIKGIPEDL